MSRAVSRSSGTGQHAPSRPATGQLMPVSGHSVVAPANPQWVQLLRVGIFQGRDGRGPYKVSNPAAIVSASQAYAGTGQLVVDYEHQADYAKMNGQPAPAAGWIARLEARRDGIWGLIQWTEHAAAMLNAKEYRYISPVFNHNRKGDISRLLRASLTNTPNLELKALASAGGGNMEDDLAELRHILGLESDASIDSIIQAVRELLEDKQSMASAAPDPSQFVPIADFSRLMAEFNRVNDGISLQAAQTNVDMVIRNGQMPPFLREWGVSLCTVNKPAFDEFIKNTGRSMQKLFTPIFAGDPPRNNSDNLTSEERSVCDIIGLQPDEFKRSPGSA